MLAFRRRSAVLAALLLAGCSASSGSLTAGSSSGGSLTAASSGAGRVAATVTRNTDGDTFWLSGIGKVRIIGVDTPEVFGRTECFGREASAFAKKLLPPGTHVTYKLGVDPRDRYGRALAYVWLADGRMFNSLLAERGYATVLTIPPNVDFAEVFLAAARRAREAGRGLWSACGGR